MSSQENTKLVEFLKMLDGEIERLDREAVAHKEIHRSVRTAVIVLSALTTIAAGAGLLLPNAHNAVQFLVLVLSAGTTATGSWGEMRRARELWQHERALYYALVDIKREIQFNRIISGEPDEEQIKTYFVRVSGVLTPSIDRWVKMQNERKESPAAPGAEDIKA